MVGKQGREPSTVIHGGWTEMSSHNNSSTAANDPRQPSTAKPFVAPAVSEQDLPVDYSGFIAVIFGIAGAMFKVRSLIFVFFFWAIFIQEFVIKFCVDLCDANHISLYFLQDAVWLAFWKFSYLFFGLEELKKRLKMIEKLCCLNCSERN